MRGSKLKIDLSAMAFTSSRRIAGIALIEALIALVVLFVAFGTIMAFHGNTVGRAAENRLVTASMSLAQDKVEELRAMGTLGGAFGSGSESTEIATFGLFGQRVVDVQLCWDTSEITSGEGAFFVQSWVERPGTTCRGTVPTADDDTVLANLVSIVAESDLRLAALQRGFDREGRGELVDLPDLIDDAIANGDDIQGDPGFKIVEIPADDGVNGVGSGRFAIIDTETGQSLVPTEQDGGQLFATINGNIFLSGRASVCGSSGSIADRCSIRVVATGNALCRVGYPEGVAGSNMPPPPAVVNPDNETDAVAYLRYTCVVADQWRGQISVVPLILSGESLVPNESEKGCVGHPGLLVGMTDTTDLLKSSWRVYDGANDFLDGDDGREIPHGINGAVIDAERPAVIGSFCAETGLDGEPMGCWNDDEIRGIVPGGHHFLVMPADGPVCSQRMTEVAEWNRIPTSPFSFDLRTPFGWNPDRWHCTSDKAYDGDFCIAVPRLSGFLNRDAAYLSPITTAVNPSLARTCVLSGPLGDPDDWDTPSSSNHHGGAFVCGVRDTWGTKDSGIVPWDDDPQTLTASARGVNFAPENYDGLIARDYPLDLTHLSFFGTSSGTPGTGNGSGEATGTPPTPVVRWSGSGDPRSLAWDLVDADQYVVYLCSRNTGDNLSNCVPNEFYTATTSTTLGIGTPKNKNTDCYAVAAVNDPASDGEDAVASGFSSAFCLHYVSGNKGGYAYSPEMP